jgi:hypothetical protein
LAFTREHARMRQAASFAPGTNIPRDPEVFSLATTPHISKRWAYSLEMNPRKAWAIGQETLHRLCTRKLPKDLNETLLFLALAKSMSNVLSSEGQMDLGTEFEEDVGRWHMILNAEDGAPLAFCEAVNDIWGINVALATPGLNPSAQDLERFQAMALYLMRQDAYSYKSCGIDDTGLVSTRADWIQRQCERSLQLSNASESNSTHPLIQAKKTYHPASQPIQPKAMYWMI